MQETALTIRPARNEDREALASILVPVVRAGETYALDRDLSEDAILAYWLGEDRATFVAEEGGLILGTYYITYNIIISLIDKCSLQRNHFSKIRLMKDP